MKEKTESPAPSRLSSGQRAALFWLICLAMVLCVALALGPWAFGSYLGSEDPRYNTLPGSPLDNLPPHIKKLTDFGMVPEWHPDNRHVVFVDGAVGNVHWVDVETGKIEPLTAHFDHHGFSRAHPLVNGDILLVGPEEGEVPEDPFDQTRRFEGKAWLLRQPYGQPAIPLGISCWEGVASTRDDPENIRIAWVESDFDWNSPVLVFNILSGYSRMYSGDLVYTDDGPRIENKELVLDGKKEFGRLTSLEPQDFRPPENEELIFSVYGPMPFAEVMGIDLLTGKKENYTKRGKYYEEPEGIFPDGTKTTMETEKSFYFGLPSRVDIWTVTLDGTNQRERLTRFTHYKGNWSADESDVRSDGRIMVFQVSQRVDECPGCGEGLLLFDLDEFHKTQSGD